MSERQDAFLKKARSIWGTKYDYSQVVYVNSHTKVKIICREHGPWIASPGNHINGPRGCPTCGGSKRKTFEEFTIQAINIHGKRYLYPKQEYLNAHTKLKIICPIHGDFEQSPDVHLRGNGCPECALIENAERSRLSEKEVNDRLRIICGNEKPLALLLENSYTGMNQKAQIICKKHGLQAPRYVTSIIKSEHPCLECAEENRTLGYTTEEFLEVVQSIFGTDYLIEPFQYKGKETLLTLHCPKENHGAFSMQAGSIYRSPGCPKCAYEKSMPKRIAALQAQVEKTQKNRAKKWLEKARERHGNRYDYSKVEFKSQHDAVVIGCPVHGFREQKAYDHLKGGCRLCAFEDLKGLYSSQYFEKNPSETNRDAYLYYIQFHSEDEVFYKVGVTVNSVKTRFTMVAKSPFIVTTLGINKTTLFKAWQHETELQRTHGDQFRYRPKLSKTLTRYYRIGPSECFSKQLPQSLIEIFFPDPVSG